MENFSKNERILGAIYFIWFFLHLGFFFYSEEGTDSSQFWPFIKAGQTLVATYDFSEFLIYIGIPLVLYIAYKIIYYDNYAESSGNRRHSTISSYFQAFLEEKIKVEELVQKINELTGLPVSYDYLDELKKDKEKAGTLGVNGWLDRVEVKKKYKEFEK